LALHGDECLTSRPNYNKTSWKADFWKIKDILG